MSQNPVGSYNPSVSAICSSMWSTCYLLALNLGYLNFRYRPTVGLIIETGAGSTGLTIEGTTGWNADVYPVDIAVWNATGATIGFYSDFGIAAISFPFLRSNSSRIVRT